MKREILTYPNPVLQQKSVDVGTPNEAVRQLVADMFETMEAAGGVGLAAIQVGVPLRLFVMEVAGKKTVLINPVIKSLLDQPVEMREGCLSIPNVFEWVPRHKRVLAEFFDLDDNCHVRLFEGLEAHAVQHETEHLDGMLFPEKLHPNKRDRVFKKFLKKAGK